MTTQWGAKLKTQVDGYVGFDSIQEQLRLNSLKRGFEFNIMVVGKLHFLTILFSAIEKNSRAKLLYWIRKVLERLNWVRRVLVSWQGRTFIIQYQITDLLVLFMRLRFHNMSPYFVLFFVPIYKQDKHHLLHLDLIFHPFHSHFLYKCVGNERVNFQVLDLKVFWDERTIREALIIFCHPFSKDRF